MIRIGENWRKMSDVEFEEHYTVLRSQLSLEKVAAIDAAVQIYKQHRVERQQRMAAVGQALQHIGEGLNASNQSNVTAAPVYEKPAGSNYEAEYIEGSFKTCIYSYFGQRLFTSVPTMSACPRS